MRINILERNNSPAICTPLTGKTKAIIMEQLDVVLTHAPNVIEWRADFLQEITDIDMVLGIIYEIKSVTKIPLLFTIRAEHEGGQKTPLSKSEIVVLLEKVCKETAVDLVDYETSNEWSFVEKIRSVTKETGKQLILSYHNFEQTPNNEELLKYAHQAEAFDADIAKFAVMPENQADVLRLLAMTRIIDAELDIPIITMSMGEIGGLSRIISWAYGSILTFGVSVESSAPGQIPVNKLREVIQLTQELVPNWK